MKKANAIVEYAVVLLVVVAAMLGIQTFLKRHIEARIKYESDSRLQHGQGLEWDASITSEKTQSTFDRYEVPGGTIVISSVENTSSVTYSPPMPPYVMEHKSSIPHVQDAAHMPPQPDNPSQGREPDRQQDRTVYGPENEGQASPMAPLSPDQ